MRRSLLLLALLLAGSSALASERIYQFRSVEDPSATADPAVCAAAPFRVNLRLAASLWSVRTRARDGKVVNDDARRIGRATACAQLTDFGFPAGLDQDFYVRVDLPDGSYTARGTCKLVSNEVPRPGVVLAGCSLRLVGGPAGALGGEAVSASVFNPFRLPGFNTGSYWTLLVYESREGDGRDHRGHHHDMELVDDARTDEQIARKAEVER